MARGLDEVQEELQYSTRCGYKGYYDCFDVEYQIKFWKCFVPFLPKMQKISVSSILKSILHPDGEGAGEMDRTVRGEVYTRAPSSGD